MNATSKIGTLKELERKTLWLSSWMIHHANHLRGDPSGLKVGGHQASCASSVSIMTALYFSALRANDRVAVKPHASPVLHAIQYLLGNQTVENMKRFRALGGAQAYPSRTKDTIPVDFSTGSVGLGAAITSFASILQDYLQAKGRIEDSDMGRMIALVGDAELDEGNIYECLLEGWKHDLRNTWWIVDYNRQSLDGIAHEDIGARIRDMFESFGWNVVTLKYGKMQEEAFREPGGDALRDWIDRCPNTLYSSLSYRGGNAWRDQILSDIGDISGIPELIDRRSDDELAALMGNLGGHCMPSLTKAFAGVSHDSPTCFMCYTVKGWGLPLAGHKDNHAGIMSPDQIELLRDAMNIRPGYEWDAFEGMSSTEAAQAFLSSSSLRSQPISRQGTARVEIEPIVPPSDRKISIQAGFGKILQAMAREGSDGADRIVTFSPDVASSTNLGPWINRRNLYARSDRADLFHEHKIPSTQKWIAGPGGQHIELGIAETNLFLALGAAGLSHKLFGERLLPIGTVYDPFIARGLDALNYACYLDSRFMLIATPSGVTLAPEGGAHQSISSPLIGMGQDGLASFEPAYVDELAVIMEWAFDYMQREKNSETTAQDWLRDTAGGSVYIRGTTRALEQPVRSIDAEMRDAIVSGGYWARKPGANCDLVIAYQGAIAPEAEMACGLLAEDRREIGLLAVTSADRLNAGWQAARRARAEGKRGAWSHAEALIGEIPAGTPIITIIDGHPATLSWLGGVFGNPVHSLGVEHFGQSGTIEELYRVHGIDCEAIVNAAHQFDIRRPVRFATV